MPWKRPGGVPRPTGARPLVAERRRYPVESATLTQHLTTERWDAVTGCWRYGLDELRVRIELEISVDERSGDGGELAPDIRLEVTTLPCPLLIDLAGRRLDELGTATGWFGSDAPLLDGIEITLQALSGPTTAAVELTAAYRWQPGRPPQALAFTGPVHVEPLRFEVRRPEHAEPFLDQAFGPDWVEAATLEEDGTFIVPDAPPERSRGHRFRLVPR